jgi:hypothetical protein
MNSTLPVLLHGHLDSTFNTDFKKKKRETFLFGAVDKERITLTCIPLSPPTHPTSGSSILFRIKK